MSIFDNDRSLIEQVTKEHLASQTGAVRSFELGEMYKEAARRSKLIEESNSQLSEELYSLRVEYQNQRHALHNAERKARTFGERQTDAQTKVTRNTIREAAKLGITLGVNLNILPSSLKKLSVEEKREIQTKFNEQVVPDHNRRASEAAKANSVPTAEEKGFIEAYNLQVAITNKASAKLGECQNRYNALAKSVA